MARKNGLYYMKTVQDRELEKRVKEKKEQLMESFRAQKEEKKKTHTSSYTPNTESQEEEYFNAISRERRRRQEEKEGMVEGVKVSQVSSSLYSIPALERQPSSELCDTGELKRIPSFKLNQGKCH